MIELIPLNHFLCFTFLSFSNAFFPPLLFRLYFFGLFLGGIYSVPPIRTKKNPVLAAFTIAIVRGFLLNFGVYYAVKDAIGASFAWSPKVAFFARFMTLFASVIAITKDLPDIEGDKVRDEIVREWNVWVTEMSSPLACSSSGNYCYRPTKSIHLQPR